MLLLAVVEIDLIYTRYVPAMRLSQLLICQFLPNPRSGFSAKSTANGALHPPACAFPCRFPARPSIFAIGRVQAYETTGIFGVAALRKKIFPGSSRMAGKPRAESGAPPLTDFGPRPRDCFALVLRLR